MAYNKNTDWDNERKYLDNLSKNGNAGQKAWAESQKKTLAAAQAQYGGSSSGGSSSGGSGSTGGTTGGTSSNKNSQYTGSSQSVKVNNSLQQAYKDEMNANSIAWYNADDAEKARLHARNQELAKLLGGTVDGSFNPITGTWGGEAGGITEEDILGWDDDYNSKNERPTQPESDPRIDAMLNEILNRDAFSYDAMNDPLYQQYANMYRREGDRAMKETLAEAAAGAGGMNTYAITAAQQANSYYNSQLNDVIPELYQAAYDKYLKDINLKVQDLGLLQDMDDKQYSRYRDTMADWKDDKNFAYGIYQDAVQQGNWQTNFDNNNYWANKNFDNNNFWANKEFDYNDMWANKEWDENQADKEYERNLYDKETAKAEIEWYIENGVTTISPELIKRAGLDQTAVNQMIAYYKAQQAQTGGTSSGGGGSKGSGTGYTGNDKKKVVEDDTGYKPKVKEEEDEGEVTDVSSSAMLALGIGPISVSTVSELQKAGAIIVKNDGSVQWVNGYGPNNWQEALNKLHTSSIFPSLMF